MDTALGGTTHEVYMSVYIDALTPHIQAFNVTFIVNTPPHFDYTTVDITIGCGIVSYFTLPAVIDDEGDEVYYGITRPGDVLGMNLVTSSLSQVKFTDVG